MSFEASPDLDVKLLNGHHVCKISHLGEVLILSIKFVIILSGLVIFILLSNFKSHFPQVYFLHSFSIFSIHLYSQFLQYYPISFLFTISPHLRSHSSLLSLCFFKFLPFKPISSFPISHPFTFPPKVLPKI